MAALERGNAPNSQNEKGNTMAVTTTKVQKHHRKAARRIVASAKSKVPGLKGMSDADAAALAALLGIGLADAPTGPNDLGAADDLPPVEGEDDGSDDDLPF